MPGPDHSGMISDTGKAALGPSPTRIIINPPFTIEGQMRDQKRFLEDRHLDTDSPHDDEGLFKLASWLPGFELNDETFASTGPGGKVGQRPAECPVFLSACGAEVACGSEHRKSTKVAYRTGRFSWDQIITCRTGSKQ